VAVCCSQFHPIVRVLTILLCSHSQILYGIAESIAVRVAVSVAVHCSVLCGGEFVSVLQGVLQGVFCAVLCCGVFVVCCSVLQTIPSDCPCVDHPPLLTLLNSVVCCSVLQYVTVCCRECCSVLQRVAMC